MHATKTLIYTKQQENFVEINFCCLKEVHKQINISCLFKIHLHISNEKKLNKNKVQIKTPMIINVCAGVIQNGCIVYTLYQIIRIHI